MDRYQQRHGLGDYADMDSKGEQTQTFRITRSLSKSSLVNGELAEGKVKEYGTTDMTAAPAPAKPPPPAGGFPRQNSLGSTGPPRPDQPYSSDPLNSRVDRNQAPPIYQPRSTNNPFAQAEYPPRHSGQSYGRYE